MSEETRSVVVRLPAETVWDFLSGYDNVLSLGWDEYSARRLRPTRKCEVRYKAASVWEGIRTSYVACLEDAERPRTLTWSTKDAGTRSWVRFDLTPRGSAATEVNATLHWEAGRVLQALEPAAWGLLRPALYRTVESLGRLHEYVSPAASRY